MKAASPGRRSLVAYPSPEMEMPMRWCKAGRLILAASALALAGGCGSAQKREAPVDPGLVFEALDKNKDGVLNPEEFAALSKDREAMNRLFKDLDQDHNGVLSRDEFKPAGLIYRW